MSTTANSSNLFDSYKQRLESTSPYDYNGRAKVVGEIQKSRRDKSAELQTAEELQGKNRNSSDARSAFAAGAASRTKKLFRPKGSAAFSGIGKADAATSKALEAKRKEVGDLNSLDPNSEVNQNAARYQAEQSRANREQMDWMNNQTQIRWLGSIYY